MSDDSVKQVHWPLDDNNNFYLKDHNFSMRCQACSQEVNVVILMIGSLFGDCL